jgi:sugar-specific transcriptional regulator TrmB
MIVDKEFLNKLKDFGLNAYESKLWTALLSRGVSTAGELSDIANVPRSRSYDVLESLEKKGFIVMKLGKPINYVAVPPHEVLERVKKKIVENAQREQKMIEELKRSEVLEELSALHSQGIEMVDPTEISGAIKGRSNLYSHIEHMIKNAEKSITIMTTEEGFLRKAESFKHLLKRAKEKGVDIKIAAPVTKKTQQLAEELKDIAQIKHIKDIKGRFVLVDKKQITFMLVDDAQVHPSYDSGVWLNTPFFAEALSEFFHREWARQ